MNIYCIVNADNGEIDYAYVPAASLEDALVAFSKVMPKEVYNFVWMFGKIGDAPYIFTDNGTRITGFECC